MVSRLRSSLSLNQEWRAGGADLARGPHQASETETESSQNKATAKGGVYVGRGEGVSKGAGWRVASDAKGRHSLCHLCVDMLKAKEALQDEAPVLG